MTRSSDVTCIVGLAKLAGIDCDDVRLKQIKPDDPLGWTAELVHQGKDVETLDREIGLTSTQALDRLRHVVDALARARLKVLSAKAAIARAKAIEASGAEKAAYRAANEAALALTSLDPATASTKTIEERLRASRTASAACDAANARWLSLHKLCGRALREREKAQDAYHEFQSRA